MVKSDFSSNQWQKLLDEIREILIYQSGIYQTISYGELCHKINSCSLKPEDEALHEALGEISVAEHRLGRGFLSVFCVGSRDNRPGKGFYKVVHDEGVTYFNRVDFVKQERERVHNIHRDPNILTI